MPDIHARLKNPDYSCDIKLCLTCFCVFLSVYAKIIFVEKIEYHFKYILIYLSIHLFKINTLRNSLRKDDNGIMVDNIRPAFSAASWGADIKLYRNFHSAASVTYPAAHVTAYIMMLVVLLLFHFN